VTGLTKLKAFSVWPFTEKSAVPYPREKGSWTTESHRGGGLIFNSKVTKEQKEGTFPDQLF
jgi:hypothetical protein